MITIKLPSGTFDYDPLKPLGRRGGFGQVFIGKTAQGDEIAVKKLHLSAADAQHRELRIADELKGRIFENVMPFIDAGQDADSGEYFVVMPKAEGNLQSIVSKNGHLSPEEASVVLLQIAKGLVEVGNLVHRDLKPDNVLLHERKWKIADFGISRFVEEATASNTLKEYLTDWYAAPEQWRSERATHATDVYALGCIAFCLLTGVPPFRNDPQAEHLTAPVPCFNCTEPRLITLVNMCMRKVAGTRPSLSRLCALLGDIVATPKSSQAASPLRALAVAAAHVSNKEQAAHAREAAANAARKERDEIANSGYEVLADNLERLWGKIHSQAAIAKREIGRDKEFFKCQLGGADLVVNLSRSNQVERGSFPLSGWDVVAFSQIYINQAKPRFCWSASLWFAKLKGQSDYRWHEASYWSMNEVEFQPYSETPGRRADMAAARIINAVNFAFGPVTIDDEQESDFHERWIWLLAKAAVGQLSRPSSMPFSWPPPLS